MVYSFAIRNVILQSDPTIIWRLIHVRKNLQGFWLIFASIKPTPYCFTFYDVINLVFSKLLFCKTQENLRQKLSESVAISEIGLKIYSTRKQI